MPSRKPLQRSEWMLFLTPLLVLGVIFLAGPLSQTLFPVPTPTPVPTPVPTPIPTLWSTRLHSDSGSDPRMLPSRDGKTIYMAGQRNDWSTFISAWDAKTGLLRHVFSGPVGRRSSLPGVFHWWSFALSDDATRLSYTWDGLTTLRTGIYDATRGTRLRFVSAQTARVQATFLPRSHTLFLGLDGRFEVWNTDSGTLLRRGAWREKDAPSSWLQSPVCSPDGQSLAVIRVEDSGGGNYPYANGRRDEIGFFSTQTWHRTHVFSWPHTEVRAIGFVDQGRKLVVNSTTVRWAKSKSGNNAFYPMSSVYLLDWKSGRRHLVRQLAVWRSYQHDLAISRDGRFFALADSFTVYRSVGHRTVTAEKEASFIEIREARTGKKMASLRLPNIGSVHSMAFAPDNSVLYYDTGSVKRWPRQQWTIGATAKPPP